MTSECESQHYRSAYFNRPLQIGLVSLALAMPVSLGIIIKIEFTPTFLLAPVIAYAMWISRSDALMRSFVLAGVCGLLSITIVNLWVPGNVKGNIVELVFWTMFAPSFVFLGRLFPLKETVFWLGLVSAAFLIVVTVPLLISGDPARAITLVDMREFGPGSSYLDIHFVGLSAYASMGVNSLAPVFCIQAALICGAFFTASRSVKAFLAAGLSCATLLIVESNSRTAQGTLILLGLAIAIFAVRERRNISAIAIIILSVLIGGVAASVRVSDDGRLAHLMTDIVRVGVAEQEEQAREPPSPDSKSNDSVVSAETPDEANPQPQVETLEEPTMESVTTGRTILWKAAIRDVMHSPIFGNGFSGYGRFFPVVTGPNTTAHCYYLTILWKGGIVFAVPFAFFIALAFRRACQHRVAGSECYFAVTALVLMFLLPSLTWDILMIPSAGALAWFVLGLLQGPFKIDSEIEYKHAAQTV